MQRQQLARLGSEPTAHGSGGLPSPLRRGVEVLSGMDMSNVVVHRNSARPAQLNAHAYAQGNEIHLGAGQEKHLPHEAWHIVQQRQGRVRATTQLAGAAINDSAELEREADVMGSRALQMQRSGSAAMQMHALQRSTAGSTEVRQCVIHPNEASLWAAVEPETPLVDIRAVINGNSELKNAYEDSLLNLHRMNFVEQAGTQPEAEYALNADGNYDINYGRKASLRAHFKQSVHFIWAMIHEMGHVNSGLQYSTNIPPGEVYHVANMHLPQAVGELFDGDIAIGKNQRNDPQHGWAAQRVTMLTNWGLLANLRTGDHGFSTEEIAHLTDRENYAKGTVPEAHYDTVLVDILYYLQHTGLTETHYYAQVTAMLREANLRRRAGMGDVAVVALVGAPANKFLQLYNATSALLNDVAWANEGEAIIGHKVPAGITSMRNALNTVANKREALNQIRSIALDKGAEPQDKRSRSTVEAYRVLRDIAGRSHFDETIVSIKLCKAHLGTSDREGAELTDL